MANTILITGASGGIGAALASDYARAGVTLLLCGRDLERLESAAATCRLRGARVSLHVFDQSERVALLQALDTADQDNPIDLAIFSAGIGGTAPPATVVENPAQVWDIATVDFTATLAGVTLIAARMQARGCGHIAVIGSVAGLFPLPMAPAYSAAKAGLAMFTEALGLRLAPHGVRVSLVAPGFVDTAMSQSLATPRPFLMTAAAAAAAVREGLSRGKTLIVLPWQFRALCAAWRLMPRALRHLTLRLALPPGI